MSSRQVENALFSLDRAVEQAGRTRARHKRLNLALFGSHIAVVAIILGMISVSYKAPVEATSQQTNYSVSVLDQNTVPSVDQIVAADVATDVAQVAQLSVVPNVESLSFSLAVKAELAQGDTEFINKPQIVEADSGRPAISSYTTVEGDTLQSVAAKFAISEDTVRWANGMTNDNLGVGRKLTIAGTTGIVYTVKAGDDAIKLAERYQADKDRIITYNNLEISGLVAGQQIVIPGGVLPETERPGFRAAPARSSVRTAVTTLGRGTGSCPTYATGYCTCYAYYRRAQLGRPVGTNWHNASNWARAAAAEGYKVDKNPEPGAVFQTGGGWGGAGHVGIVEKVNADGSFETSEMNYSGWNRVSSRTITAGEVSQYNYIH